MQLIKIQTLEATLELLSGLRIGASYDFNISSLKAATASRGGSEFSIIFIKRPAEYKGIPCPKF